MVCGREPRAVNPSALRTVGPAIAASSMAVLPIPLVGGFAVLLQRDLGFGEAQLGLAVAAFFAAAAATAAPAGRLSEVLGPRPVARIGLGCIVASLLGIAFLARSWESLAALLALAGAGHASSLLAVGVMLSRSVAVHRHGLAFGVSQAAAPLSALLAGLSVPVIGLTLGWQVAFVTGAGLAVLAGFAIPSVAQRATSMSSASSRDAPLRSLIPLAVGMALASAGGNSSAVFLAASAVDRGFGVAGAGLLLAFASVIGVTTRVAAGWLSDRLNHGSLALMAVLIASGAVGYVVLAVSAHQALIVVASALAFGGGWGWPGLMLLAVTRSNPGAPGLAMGVVTVGGLGGAVIGPLAFGAVAEQTGFPQAWLLMAAASVAAIAMILTSRRLLLMARPGSLT
jgi:MFS family permease